MWRHSQENSIKSDVWVCLKIGISPSHGNFHRENDERDQGRWVLRPWEGADQQLRLDFAYNFTGFGCGTLAFWVSISGNQCGPARNLIMDPAPRGYFFPLFISELAEGAPIPPAGAPELNQSSEDGPNWRVSLSENMNVEVNIW